MRFDEPELLTRARWQFLMCVAFLAISCANEDTAWDESTALDTVESYRAFLATYPASVHAREAHTGIRRILNANQVYCKFDKLAAYSGGKTVPISAWMTSSGAENSQLVIGRAAAGCETLPLVQLSGDDFLLSIPLDPGDETILKKSTQQVSLRTGRGVTFLDATGFVKTDPAATELQDGSIDLASAGPGTLENYDVAVRGFFRSGALRIAARGENGCLYVVCNIVRANNSSPACHPPPHDHAVALVSAPLVAEIHARGDAPPVSEPAVRMMRCRARCYPGCPC